MDPQGYRRRAIELLDGYLAGRAAAESVWRWAEGIILSAGYDRLPEDLQDRLHGIWLLHDGDASWVPGPGQLARIRDELALLLPGSENTEGGPAS